MPGYISEKMLCEACQGYFDDLLERDLRNEYHNCKLCGEPKAKRTWTVPNVSTAKLSKSIPDGTTNRFEKHRLQQELRKEKAGARERGDLVSEKKINKELQKVKK